MIEIIIRNFTSTIMRKCKTMKKIPFLKEGAKLQWTCTDNDKVVRSGVVTVLQVRSNDFIVTRDGFTEKGKPAKMFCAFPTNKKETVDDRGIEIVTHKQSGLITEDALLNEWVDTYHNKDTGIDRRYHTKSIFKLIK